MSFSPGQGNSTDYSDYHLDGDPTSEGIERVFIQNEDNQDGTSDAHSDTTRRQISPTTDSDYTNNQDYTSLKDFLVVADGHCAVDLETLHGTEGLSSGLILTRASTNVSANSSFSTDTVIPAGRGGYGLPLEHLCRLIISYPSLQDAKIVASECYTKRIRIGFGMVHRYIVLELRREGKKHIWVRLDRTRHKAEGTLTFLMSGGSTRANDVACLTARKDLLIQGGSLENRQVFTQQPSLWSLYHLLVVICKELETYKLWPQNCWFFVSLLQEHLSAIGRSSFTLGSLPVPNLEQDLRRKIWTTVERAQEARSRRLSYLLNESKYGSTGEEISSYDIMLYVRHCLRPARGLDHGYLDILIEKADQSLVWAALACRYIMAVDGFNSKATQCHRLEQVIKSDSALAALYITVLQGCAEDNDNETAMHVLGLIPLEDSAATAEPIYRRHQVIGGPAHFPYESNLSNLAHLTRQITWILPYGTPRLDSYLTNFLVDALGTKEYRVAFAEARTRLGLCSDIEHELRTNARNLRPPERLTPSHLRPPQRLTPSDIRNYMLSALPNVQASERDVEQLVAHAGSSFVWAVTSCRFICGDGESGDMARQRLSRLIICSGDLSSLYDAIIGYSCSVGDEEIVKSCLSYIACGKPLPLAGYCQAELMFFFPPLIDHAKLYTNLKPLNSVLNGIGTDTLVVPYDSSFSKHLKGQRANGSFWVNSEETLRRLKSSSHLYSTLRNYLRQFGLTQNLVPAQIQTYIRCTLNNLPSANVAALCELAGDSSVWAALACRFITTGDQGLVIATKRSDEVIRSGSTLNDLYSTIFTYGLDQAHVEIAIRLSILVTLVQKPSTIEALYWRATPKYFSDQVPVNIPLLGVILSHLEPIFCTTDDSTIVPWHPSSFEEFVTSRPIRVQQSLEI